MYYINQIMYYFFNHFNIFIFSFSGLFIWWRFPRYISHGQKYFLSTAQMEARQVQIVGRSILTQGPSILHISESDRVI